MAINRSIKQFRRIVLSIFLTAVGLKSALAGAQYYGSGFKQSKPFFYEVEKDGKVSYILGSMHAGILINSYPDQVFELSKKAKNIAFESEADVFHERHKDELKERSSYSKGEILEQHLSPQAIEKLKELWGAEGYEKIKVMKPWMVSGHLAEAAKQALNKQVGSEIWNYSNGIDHVLLDQSKKNRKVIHYLDDESKVIDHWEESTTVADLEKLLSYPDPIAHRIDCGYAAQSVYYSGRSELFETYYKKCCSEGDVRTADRRTLSWLPKLEPLLNQGDAFVVVGASHVVGENGLEQLLEARGYKVKRIEPTQTMQGYPLGYPNPYATK